MAAPAQLIGVLDSDAINALRDPARRAQWRAAVSSGRLRLLRTHVVEDQVRAIRNKDQLREELLEALLELSELTPTSHIVLGISRYGQATYGEPARLQALTPGLQPASAGNMKDALIAATAELNQAVLITYDARLTKRAVSRSLTVLTPEDLDHALLNA